MVDRAFGGEQGAGIVLRVGDGKILAMHNQRVLAQRVATPGSAIKPFVLELMIEKGAVRPTETIACRRPLVIGGRSLNCSHPVEISNFAAEDALAYSCNTYFVTAATKLARGELEKRFEQLNFAHPSGILPDEGDGRITRETSLQDRQLLAVGAAEQVRASASKSIGISGIAKCHRLWAGPWRKVGQDFGSGKDGDGGRP